MRLMTSARYAYGSTPLSLAVSTSDGRPVLATAVGPGKERVLAIECNWPDRAFDHVGVDLDPAVIEEACQACPARERAADRFGELALLADQGKFLAQSRLEGIDDRPGLLLAGGAALLRRAPPDIALDLVSNGIRKGYSVSQTAAPKCSPQPDAPLPWIKQPSPRG